MSPSKAKAREEGKQALPGPAVLNLENLRNFDRLTRSTNQQQVSIKKQYNRTKLDGVIREESATPSQEEPAAVAAKDRGAARELLRQQTQMGLSDSDQDRGSLRQYAAEEDGAAADYGAPLRAQKDYHTPGKREQGKLNTLSTLKTTKVAPRRGKSKFGVSVFENEVTANISRGVDSLVAAAGKKAGLAAAAAGGGHAGQTFGLKSGAQQEPVTDYSGPGHGSAVKTDPSTGGSRQPPLLGATKPGHRTQSTCDQQQAKPILTDPKGRMATGEGGLQPIGMHLSTVLKLPHLEPCGPSRGARDGLGERDRPPLVAASFGPTIGQGRGAGMESTRPHGVKASA